MKFNMVHTNINVLDLEKSLKFYDDALGLKEVRRLESKTGDFTIVYVADEHKFPLLELTYLAGRTGPYDLGDNEWHVAFETDDFDAAHEKHKKMGCICYENPGMGIYFIEDPDGYWLEVLKAK